MRALLALTTLAAIAAAMVAALAVDPQSSSAPSEPPPPPPRRPRAATPAPVRTPAPPRVSRAAINRQDRTSPQHRAREARAYDTRPLLTRLPLTRDGVRIDIAGLAADDRTVILALDPGGRSRAHARDVYRQALRAAGEPGNGYALEWAR